MRRERGQQHEPPQTGWCEQKRCNHNRIRRPKNGYWMRLKRECKTDFAPKIVSSEHPQPDHQQMPVKNCANSVRVPCGRLNVRGFKRDGSTFHQSEKVFSGRCAGGAIVDVTTAGTVPTTRGTRGHAYQPLSTFRIIHGLLRGQKHHFMCRRRRLRCAREGTRTPTDFSTRS